MLTDSHKNMWLELLLPLFFLAGRGAANYPLFDESTKMRVLLVPADTRVGTTIYRLRATDSDYDFPLTFDVLGMLFFMSINICMYTQYTLYCFLYS
jgi:hypothetical protein